MSSSGWAHPLDVDLADLVDGTVPATQAERIDAHLAECLLCRIKCERLRRAPPPGPVTPLPAPGFTVPAVEEAAEAGDPAAGELWLAGSGDRILVLVLRRTGDRALVAPVTLDVESADDETLLVDAEESPAGMPLAVHPSLATEVPAGVLSSRVGMGRLAADGPRRRASGTPLEGPTDPRLQVRQHLADRLGSLEDTPPDPASAADAPRPTRAEIRSALAADLRAMRGAACRVSVLDQWGDTVIGAAAEWTPLITIDEVGIVLVVFDTPHGLADDPDFNAARSVLTRLNATALVVLSADISDEADVFDAAALSSGIDMPSGAHTPPRPLITGLAPVDAIAKYLDQHTGTRTVHAPSRGALAHVDVADVLRDAAVAALADTVRQGARIRIAPKRRGYESVAGSEDALAAALGGAFTDASVVEALLEAARRRGG